MTLRFVSDPGHGWLRVVLKEYPDALESATGYGFWAGTGHTAVYLEEDIEASDFLERHPEIRWEDIPQGHVARFDRNVREPLPRNLTYEQYVARQRAHAGVHQS